MNMAHANTSSEDEMTLQDFNVTDLERDDETDALKASYR